MLKNLSVEVEVNADKLLSALVEDIGVDPMTIIEQIDVKMADQDFTNEAYEYFRQAHLELLKEMGITEKQYREEFCHDPSIYEDEDAFVETETGSGVEVYVSEDELDGEDEEPWTTAADPEMIEEGALVLGDEEDVDVFSTETEH